MCARTDIGGLLTRQVAVSEMLHVYEVRRALELEAVRLACVRRTDDDVRRLREALDLRNETGRTGDGGAFADADLAFHVAVVAAAHNPVLDELFAGISEPLRATYDFTEGVHEPELGAGHHRNVVDGIEQATSRSRRAAHAVISTCSSPGCTNAGPMPSVRRARGRNLEKCISFSKGVLRVAIYRLGDLVPDIHPTAFVHPDASSSSVR